MSLENRSMYIRAAMMHLKQTDSVYYDKTLDVYFIPIANETIEDFLDMLDGLNAPLDTKIDEVIHALHVLGYALNLDLSTQEFHAYSYQPEVAEVALKESMPVPA